MDKIGASKKIVEETRSLYVGLIAEPLSEKQLSRPPFKFIQNLVKSLINETRILKDEFNQTDFDSRKQWDKRAKAQFIQKLIDFVANNKLPVIGCVASKVIAGLEPNKTNELLQSLARIAQRKLANKQDRPQTFTKKPISKDSPSSSANSINHKPETEQVPLSKVEVNKPNETNQWDLVRGINQVRANLRNLQRNVKEAAKIEELLREQIGSLIVI